MSRVLTTYNRPSILRQIETALSFKHLSALRTTIGLSYRMGKMDAEKKTLRQWDDAFYSRLIFILLRIQVIEELCLAYEEARGWMKDPQLDTLIEQAFQARAAQLPNPTQRLLAAGVTIEGVTTR